MKIYSVLKFTLILTVFIAQPAFGERPYWGPKPAAAPQAAQPAQQPAVQDNLAPQAYGGSIPSQTNLAPQAYDGPTPAHRKAALSEIARLRAEVARLRKQNAIYKKQAVQSCEQTTVSSNDVKQVVPTGASTTGQNDGSSGSASGGDTYGFTLGGGSAPVFTLPPGSLDGGNANGK
jgi:hypothetical protein